MKGERKDGERRGDAGEKERRKKGKVRAGKRKVEK